MNLIPDALYLVVNQDGDEIAGPFLDIRTVREWLSVCRLTGLSALHYKLVGQAREIKHEIDVVDRAKQPREWWVVLYDNKAIGVCSTQEHAESVGSTVVHVREVVE